MVRRYVSAILALALLAVSVFTALAQDATGPVAVRNHPSLGSILTDAGGLTVYTLSSDSLGVSTCSDACARSWPPLVTDQAAMAGMGVSMDSMMMKADGLGVLQRADGTYQVTFGGMALYRFAGDQRPGDATGQNINAFGGIWLVVMADESMLMM